MGKQEKNDKFKRDLDFLVDKMKINLDIDTLKNLNGLRDKLVKLHEKNVVKINHSIMELVCSKFLLLKGYKVDVERVLGGGLNCDLYGIKGDGSLIIEIETGFVPPEHALDPMTYCRARIASKIIRYSSYANRFCLGTPPHYVMQIPPALTKPPRYRELKELQEIKHYCDRYYQSPPISLDEVRNARLHAVYVLYVDEATVRETDSDLYVEKFQL